MGGGIGELTLSCFHTPSELKQSPGGDWHLTPKRTGMHGHKLPFGKCVLLGTFKGETMRLIPCTIVLTLASPCRSSPKNGKLAAWAVMDGFRIQPFRISR